MLRKITYGCQISLCLKQNEDVYITTDRMNDELILRNLSRRDHEIVFDKCVFIIIPVLSHMWIGKLIDEVDRNLTEIQKLKFKDRQRKIKELELNLEEEMHANYQCFQKQQDTTLLYGTSTFHLVHKDSLKFLQITYDGVNLIDFPNESTVLHFQPVYQYQKQIQAVFDTETAAVCSAKIMHNRILYLITKYEEGNPKLDISVETFTNWRLNIYSIGTENDDYLKSSELVAINLSESNLFLNAKQPYDPFKRVLEYEIGRLKGMKHDTLTQIIYDDLEVQFDDVIERIGVKRVQKLQSSSFWKLEKFNNTGGNIYWFEPIRMRHNQSGRYLCIRNGKPELTTQCNENTLFILIPIEQSNCLKKDSYFMVKHCQSNTYFENHQFRKSGTQQTQQLIEQDVNGNTKLLRIRKIGEDEDWETKILQYSVPIVIQVINIIEEIDDIQDIEQINYKESDLKIEFYGLYKKLLFILDYIEKFVQNKIITNLQTTQKYDQLSFIRQDQFRQESLFPLICLLLFKLFPDSQEEVYTEDKTYQEDEIEFFQISKQTSHSKRDHQAIQEYHNRQIRIIQLKLINTLTQICKGNLDNQYCLFEFLPISFKAITKFVEVTQLLTLLITKNAQTVEELSKVQLITPDRKNEGLFLIRLIQFMRYIPSHSRPDLVNFLATACSYGVSAVYANQEIIFKYLIEDPRQRNHILIRYLIEKEKGIVMECKDYSGQPTLVTFEEFFDDQHKRINPNYHEELVYLQAQFRLFSQLCLSRNYQSFKYFQDYFPDNALVPLLFQEKIDENMRAYLFSLCKNLYLDREPYTAQIRPNLIKNMYAGELFDEFMDYDATKYENKWIYDKELEYILQGFKRDLINFFVRRVDQLKDPTKYDNVYNQLTLEIIRILYMILQFGLFQIQDKSQNKRKLEEDQKFNETQLEKLIISLAQLLEYDYDYFQALQPYQALNTKKRVLKLLNIQSIKYFRKQKSKQSKQSNQNQFIYLRDPLLRKLSSIKKVLSKFHNKTCGVQNQPSDYEIEIKIEVCKCFSYLIDLRLDYMIDNALAYFEKNFKSAWKPSKEFDDQPIVRRAKKFESQYVQLLKEEMLLPGQSTKFFQQNYKDYKVLDRMRHFDRILDKPFVQVLLKSFYFANDALLQNYIIELIERFNGQKSEFKLYLNSIQLIITMEVQQIYWILFRSLEYLKNQILNSQVWLQLDTPIHKNAQNEEIMEEVLDKLLELQVILTKKTNDGNEKQIRKMFLNIGGFNLIQKLIIKCLLLIDVNIDIFEAQEYEEQLHYKQELAEKIMTMFQACIKIVYISNKFEPQNQEFIFIRLARPLLKYVTLNLGQIELINELLIENNDLIPFANSSDFILILNYIKLHGKYAEFLQLFLRIAQESTLGSLHKDILQAILSIDHDYLNPFVDTHRYFERFYPYQNNLTEYKQTYLKIIELLLTSNVSASLEAKLMAQLNFQNIIEYMLEKVQEMRNIGLEQTIQEQVLQLKITTGRILFSLARQKKSLMKQDDGFIIQIITIEAIWLSNQIQLIKIARQYIIEVLLPFINLYNEYYCQQSSFKSDHPQVKQYAQAILKQYYQLIKDQESNTAANYQVHRILRAFELKCPEDDTDSETELNSGDQLEEGVDTYKPETQYRLLNSFETEYNSDSATFEIWELFKKQFNTSKKVNISVVNNQLAKSIWQVSEMYTADYLEDSQKQELILANDDIIQKMLIYLQFWKSNKSQKFSAIFIIKLLTQILQLDDNRGKFLDNLGATKIIITLIWEENESDNDYIEQLLTLLKQLMTYSQVQKTTLMYLNSAISSDKFFQKFETLISRDQENNIVHLTLQIIELMCANNNLELQCMLRYQKNNKKSFDIPTQIIQYLCSLEIIKYELVIQCLTTIRSLVNACKPNQILVTNSKLIEYLVKLLNDSQFTEELTKSQLVYIKHKALRVLLGLTEMNAKDDYIIVTLKKMIPLTVLVNHFSNVYFELVQRFGEEQYSKEIFIQADEFILESGFNAYILYIILQDIKSQIDDSEDFRSVEDSQLIENLMRDNLLKELTTFGKSLMQHGLDQLNELKQQFSGEVQDKIQKIRKHEIIHKSMLFFKQNTLQVEFVKEDSLYVTYFPRLACFNHLPQQMKDDFMQQVDRTSTKTKIMGLITFQEQALKIMFHQERLEDFFKQHQILNIFARRGRLWIKLAFYNALAINVIIVLSYTQEAFPYSDYQTMLDQRLNDPRFLGDPTNYSTSSIILTLGCLNLGFNVIILFFYLLDKAPVKIGFVWSAWQAESLIGKCISILIKLIITFIVLFIDFDILYYILQIIFNILGIVFHPFFYAFHLLHILYLEPLIPILKAVWIAKYKFVGLWIITVIWLYWYAIISYVFFPEFFQSEMGYNYCNELWRCVYVTFDWTFKTNGAIGQKFTQAIGQDEEQKYMSYLNNYFGRFFYDNGLNASIKLCIVNILLAVIVVSYSKLRSIDKMRNLDQIYKCFICGIERYVFDKNSKNTGFWHHIKNEHNIWSYLYYICYIKILSDDQLNGNDLYIKQQVQQSDNIQWFPIRRARMLSNKKQELKTLNFKNSFILNKISLLHTTLKKSLKIMNNL